MADGTKSDQGTASMDGSRGQGGGSMAIYEWLNGGAVRGSTAERSGARRRGQATAMEVPMDLDSNEIGNTAALRTWGRGTTSGAARERRHSDAQRTGEGLPGLVRR
jgi:hypothetical protein